MQRMPVFHKKKAARSLYIKAEMHNVAVFYYIVFAFQSKKSFIPGRSHRSAAHEILVSYNFRAMNPFSKSEWITPAACGAFMPWRMVHARTSCTPAVK